MEGHARFARFDPAMLPELMGWFRDPEALRAWGGPDACYPFTPEIFRVGFRASLLHAGPIIPSSARLGP